MMPVCFYTGAVSHHRIGKISHALNYKIAYVLLDLDRIETANGQSRFLGVGAGGLMSVRAEDHGDGGSTDLAGWVRGYLRDHNISETAVRIELLTLPRMFGYVFNPVSVYFIYDAAGALHHLLYEVNNTFSERHFYLCPSDKVGERHQQSCAKEFYVSPFFEVDGRYQFSVRPPGEEIELTIRYDCADRRPAMNARLHGVRRPVTNRNCLKILAGFPLMTLGVIAAIQWEAVKLMIKGARFRWNNSVSARAGTTMGAAATRKPAVIVEKKAA